MCALSAHARSHISSTPLALTTSIRATAGPNPPPYPKRQIDAGECCPSQPRNHSSARTLRNQRAEKDTHMSMGVWESGRLWASSTARGKHSLLRVVWASGRAPLGRRHCPTARAAGPRPRPRMSQEKKKQDFCEKQCFCETLEKTLVSSLFFSRDSQKTLRFTKTLFFCSWDFRGLGRGSAARAVGQ